MSIYEMDFKKLLEYKNETVSVMEKYQEAGETILADLVKNQIRIIDRRIQFLRYDLG